MVHATRHDAAGLIRWLVVALLIGATVSASDWPQWRGKNRDGVSTETGWLTNWPPATVWSRTIGSGVSSVAISEGRLYTMGLEGNGLLANIVVYCLDASNGTNLWTYSYPVTVNEDLWRPCATPTVVSNEVYTYDDVGMLYCFDKVTGNALWNTQVALARPRTRWSDSPLYASSPLVLGDAVHLNASGLGAAVNRLPPYQLLWPAEDTTNAAAYASPLPMTIEGQTVLLLQAEGALRALNPSDGQVLWNYPYKTVEENMADPVVYGDKIFLAEKGKVLLEPTLTGVTEYWPKSTALKTMGATPVVVGEYAYVVDKFGELVCTHVPTGAEQWRQPGFVTSYSSYKVGSLIAADGKLIILADGKLRVVKATHTGFDEEGRSAVVLSSDATDIEHYARALPVLANGRLYCRLKSTLVCYQAGPAPAADANFNGIADVWEQQYFGGAASPTADADGDGQSNREEFAAGTNPTNATSVLRLQTVRVPAGLEVRWPTTAASGVAGYQFLTRYYTLETTTNLSGSAVWSPVPGYTDVVGNGSAVTCTNNLAGPGRFFRVKVRLE